MLPIIERGKRAFRRVTHHLATEVTNIRRMSPTTWLADLVIRNGRVEWTETVRFTRTRDTQFHVITVTDADFPNDRKRVLRVPVGTPMSSTITSFLLSGRW